MFRLLEPFVVSYATYDSMPSIILTLETDDGSIGYGESVPDETHHRRNPHRDVVEALKTELFPAILGLDPRDITAVHQQLNRALQGLRSGESGRRHCLLGPGRKGSRTARSTRCWADAGRTAHHRQGDEHPCTGSPCRTGNPGPGQGYRHLKMKLGGNDGLDIERVRAVRAAINDDLAIRVDANQGWCDPATARAMIRALEPYRIDWVEQPILRR